MEKYSVLPGNPYLSPSQTIQYENWTVIPSRQVRPPNPHPLNPLSYSSNRKGGDLTLERGCSSRVFIQMFSRPEFPRECHPRLSIIVLLPTCLFLPGPQPGYRPVLAKLTPGWALLAGLGWCWPINDDILAVVRWTTAARC